MDLVKWRNRHGQAAINALFERAGFPVGYGNAVMNGFKPVSLQRARVLVALEPSLDVLALVNQHVTILSLKAEKGKKWRTDKKPVRQAVTKSPKSATTNGKKRKRSLNAAA